MASTSTIYSYSDTFEFEGSPDASAVSGVSRSVSSLPRDSKQYSDSFSRSISSPEADFSRFEKSSVSDTLTYRSDDGGRSSFEEGCTDADSYAYSDTFEDTGKTQTQDASKSYLETVRSSTGTQTLSRITKVSKSYLETVDSSGTTNMDTKASESYLESVASLENTSGVEQKYFDESFESPSPSGTSLDLHTFDMTESHIFGPATEEIRELTEEDLMKAEAFEARENFINHWTSRLKKSTNKAPPDRVSFKPHHRKKKSESEEQKSFCRKKINQLKENKQGVHKLDKKGHQDENAQKEKWNKMPVEAYGLNSVVIERLRLENVLSKMQKLSSEEIHDVKTCKTCCKQQQHLEEAEARKQFLRYHCTRLRSRETDILVEKHLTRMTSLNMIGEILRDLPRLRDTNADELLYQYKIRVQKRMVPS